MLRFTAEEIQKRISGKLPDESINAILHTIDEGKGEELMLETEDRKTPSQTN